MKQETKKFAIIGVGGYIAKRHIEAIKELGGDLVLCCDKVDNVGFLDNYFPKTIFYKDEVKFFNDCAINKIDYLVVCTPNYLHKDHICQGLSNGMNVITEKPICLTKLELLQIQNVESRTGKFCYSILQLRLHDAILNVREKFKSVKPNKIDLTYITSRGQWYDETWKSKKKKSGGIETNIGIHFFDMLCFILDDTPTINYTHLQEEKQSKGHLYFPKSDTEVEWFLSIDENHLPKQAFGKRTFREITFDGIPLEFSEGFTELHIKSYEQILNGYGFGTNENLKAIEIIDTIR